MNKNPLVSVIIPVFNEEKYINSCFSSIVEQTYKNLEIIVVDDGSKDKSLEIIRKFGFKFFTPHPMIRSSERGSTPCLQSEKSKCLDRKVVGAGFIQKHKGPGAARNLGAEKALGEILVFCDADMKYDKNYVEKLIQPIVQHDAIGTFNKDEFVENKDNIWSNCWAINSNLPLERHSPLNLPKTQNIFRAIKKKKFMEIGGFDVSKGYYDDSTIAKKLKVLSVVAPGAIAYHFNPGTLEEVFYSSRWIGRGGRFKKNIINFLKFSPLNSIRISFIKIIKGAPFRFLIFKLVFDFGMFSGIFLSFGKKEK